MTNTDNDSTDKEITIDLINNYLIGNNDWHVKFRSMMFLDWNNKVSKSTVILDWGTEEGIMLEYVNGLIECIAEREGIAEEKVRLKIRNVTTRFQRHDYVGRDG